MNKSFPAYEGFISDAVDNKVFLSTNPAPSESELMCELTGYFYDHFNLIDIKIEIDPLTGMFKNEVIFGSVSNDIAISQNRIDAAGTNTCVANVEMSEPPIFEYTNWNMGSWNTFHLGKNPAVDCLNGIPCCGNLGSCPQNGSCN